VAIARVLDIGRLRDTQDRASALTTIKESASTGARFRLSLDSVLVDQRLGRSPPTPVPKTAAMSAPMEFMHRSRQLSLA
jgi:hypothetical protein